MLYCQHLIRLELYLGNTRLAVSLPAEHTALLIGNIQHCLLDAPSPSLKYNHLLLVQSL